MAQRRSPSVGTGTRRSGFTPAFSARLARVLRHMNATVDGLNARIGGESYDLTPYHLSASACV